MSHHCEPVPLLARPSIESIPMVSLGLIVGHGYTKLATPQTTVTIPSVAAPADAVAYESALGGLRNVVDLGEAGRWLTGADALAYAPGRLVSILDRARYQSPAFVALARTALFQAVAEVQPLHILTGMPAAWFGDKHARSALTDALAQAAQPWGGAKITIAPEAAGVFYAYVFEGGQLDFSRKAQRVGVIDAGYRDVNIAYFDSGRYIGGESVPGGAYVALQEIKQLISAQYGIELPLHDVDHAVQRGGLTYEGRRSPLPDGSETALLRALDTVIAAGRSLWPNGGRSLDVIVLGGGGAHALGSALSRQLTQLYPLAQPQQAGAVGFQRMMRASLSAASARAAA